MTKREQILALLRDWIEQRPGLDPRDYGGGMDGWRAYRAESRSITRDLHTARTLLRAVEWRESITEQHLRDAFRAFSGRLSLVERDDGKMYLDYCTGQYWSTEYRRAACAVLASALWDWTRAEAMPQPQLMNNSETGETLERYNGKRAGDWLCDYFRREFGRGIQQTWFR